MSMQLRATILAAIDSGVVTLPGVAESIGRPAHHLTQTLANLMADGVLVRDGTRRHYRYRRPGVTPVASPRVSSVWDFASV